MSRARMQAGGHPRRRRRPWTALGLIAVLGIALLAGLAGPSASPADPALPQAQTETPLGIAPALLAGDPTASVRVAVLLRQQPVLERAQRPSFKRQLAGGHPHSPTVGKRAFSETKRKRRIAIRGLRPAARTATRLTGALAEAIKRGGGLELERRALPAGVVALVPRSALRSIAARPDVQVILPAPKRHPVLDLAAGIDGATNWWSADHTGGEGAADTNPGVDVGLSGDTPDPTHPAFAGVTIDNAPGQPTTDHGTHTGGIVASQHPTYRGLAFGIDRLVGGLPDYELGVGMPAASDIAEVMSESFAGAASADDDGDAVYTDALSEMLGVSWSAAAGNDGTCGGLGGGIAQCVASPSTARNALSVGAYSDESTATTADDQVATFSSRGPTYAPAGQSDGRKKPDLTAPGVGIFSPTANWNASCPGEDPDDTCADFSNFTGTSASTPQVAAGAALLEGAGVTDPRAVKAILINSARPFNGQTQWQPDVGWGALDLTTAFAQRGDFETSSVPGGGAKLYRVNAAPEGAKATLTWFRRANWGAFPNCCATTFTTSNLDLHAYRASDDTEIDPNPAAIAGAGPEHLDDNDTVEQVKTPNGEGAQNVIYKVKAASTVVGAAAEPFAIAAAGPITPMQPPEVQPQNTIAAPSAATSSPGVPCGSGVTITTELHNGSADFDAEDASVELTPPAGVHTTFGDATQPLDVGTLVKGATSELHQWTVVPETPGTYPVRITGHGGTLGDTFDYPQTINITCHFSQPPQVRPVNAAFAPSAPALCGTEVVLTAKLQNNSIDADAENATVRLTDPEGRSVLPAATHLVAGPLTQSVSGGTLLKGGTISEEHTWTLRQFGGTTQLTLMGDGTAAGRPDDHFSYTKQLQLSCIRHNSSLKFSHAARKRDVIEVSGSLSGSVKQSVTVVARRGRHTRKVKVRTDAHHHFHARLHVCFSGRWVVKASYAGNGLYKPSTSGSRHVAVPARALRC